jgi:hypothetical protein
MALGKADAACHREPLEVFGFQRGLALARLQQPVRLGPRLSVECFPATL